MLKPSLQLKLGQQLTMTPQLQQAIRLLQLPALELQAHIRELLETNVMLEPTEEAESTGTFEVQALDPSGVGARSVAECIELQLRQLDPETPGLATALEIARAHLELLAGREFTLLRRELRVSEEELAAALALVRSCHPHPGAIVSAGAPEYVVPDV